MEQKKSIFIVKKLGNRSKKSATKTRTEDPYVLYKLDGKIRKTSTIIKSLEKNNSSDKIHKHIKTFIKNGESYQGVHLSSLKKGTILIKSEDELYAIYKEDETNSIYLLMFLKYDDIKNRLNRIKKGH